MLAGERQYSACPHQSRSHRHDGGGVPGHRDQASARGGYIDVHLKGDRVDLTGKAVTITRGELTI